jgi:hypothetical protein
VRSQPFSPQIWRPLIRITARESLLIGLLGILFFSVVYLPAYNMELNGTGEDPDKTLRRRLTLSERLGYAVLLNSSLINFKQVVNRWNLTNVDPSLCLCKIHGR